MFLRKRNLIFLFVMHFMFLAFFLPGCKEGTKTSPSSALLDISSSTAESTNSYTVKGTVYEKVSLEKLGNITVTASCQGVYLPVTRTTSEGKFFLFDAAPGLYDLVFSSPDGAYATTTYIIQVLENGTMSPSSPEVKMPRSS